MSKSQHLRARSGETVRASILADGQRFRAGEREGVCTCHIHGAPFVRWVLPDGRESDGLFELRDVEVEVIS